tara:strand:- start:524 stop:805 length:282 start_codon:yes stop_codon:yes gene_type:complete
LKESEELRGAFLRFFFLVAFNRAAPPPATIPSSKAALVAWMESSTLSFFSLSSTSELPANFIVATPPASFDNLSFRCHLSDLFFVSFISLVSH